MQVILVAHGPGPVTKRAVRRLTRIRSVEQVWLVAATERAHRGLSKISGGVVADGFGTASVRAVASGLGDVPVLLIHDDAAVTGSGVTAMAEVLDRPGVDFVVPHSNEVGTPQFAGPLPGADEAGAVLDRVHGLGAVRRLAAARHSCLMASGTDLASVEGTLVVPGGSLVRSDTTIMLAPVAVAHDLSCHTRLEPDDGGRPVIVASMIVRDEEGDIEAAIRSLDGLVDRVEICDTGSVDDTVRIARGLGAHVREIAWRDDFAWARNQALDACRDADFFLMLDADERVVVDDPRLFRRWLRTWRHELQGVLVELRNQRGDGGPSSTHRAMRVASTRGSRWHGALHETVRFEDQDGAGVVFYAGLAIDHHGYDRSVVAAKGKAQRNIAIARAAFATDPNPKTMIDYARSLRMEREDDPEAERLFRRALEELDPDAPAVVQSYLLATVAAYEMATGRRSESARLALASLAHTPLEDVALVTIGSVLAAEGEWSRLVEVWEDVSARPSPSPMFVIDANAHRFRAHVARALAAVGRFGEAASLLTEVVGVASDAISQTVQEAVAGMVEAGVEPSLLVPALVADTHGAVVSGMARRASPPLLAEACLAALASGSSQPAVFTTGFAASLIRPGTDLPDRLARFSELAPAAQRPALADMAARRGRPDLAEHFETSTLVLSGELFT